MQAANVFATRLHLRTGVQQRSLAMSTRDLMYSNAWAAAMEPCCCASLNAQYSLPPWP